METWREVRAAVGIFVVFATTLAIAIPPFEAPDEPSHLAYINFVATRLALPNQNTAATRVDGQGHQAPLYYLLASVLVRTAKDDDHVWVLRHPNTAHVWHGGDRMDVPLYRDEGTTIFPSTRDRLGFYALRLGAVGLGAATIVCVGVTAGMLLGPGAATIAALLTATLPQFAGVACAITADDLVQLLAALFAWQLVSLMLRPTASATATRTGVFLGLALVTKKTAICLVPGAPIALVAGVLIGTMSWATAARRCGRVIGVALVFVLPWLVRNHLLYGDPLGSAMEKATLHALVAEKSLGDPWFRTTFAPWFLSSFVGVLGWMNLWLPGPIYGWYGVLALLGLVGLGLRASRPWRANLGIGVAAVFVLASCAGVVHLNRTFSQPQGRYLFVVMPFIATLVTAGLLEVARRVRLPADRLWWILLVPSLAVALCTLRQVLVFFAVA